MRSTPSAPKKLPPTLMPLIEDTSKYEWSACWKSNSALPVLATFTLQSSDVPVTERRPA